MSLTSPATHAVAAVAALALGCAVLTGCGAAEDPATTAGSTTDETAGDEMTPTPTGPATTGPPEVVRPAEIPAQLDFTAETVDGAPFDGRSFAGQDALVYFWAPWCPTCRREAPGLVDLIGGYPDLAFVTVGGSSSDRTAMADFISDVGFDDFTNVADVTGEIWTRFEVPYQPAYAFVDASGAVEVMIGSVDEADLRSRIDTLLAS